MTKTEFDEFAHRYENLASQNKKFLMPTTVISRVCVLRLSGDFSVRTFGRYLTSDAGWGLASARCAMYFSSSEVLGCDLSQDLLEIARTREPECEFLAPEAIPAAPRFDIIVAVCVFHHIAPANWDAT